MHAQQAYVWKVHVLSNTPFSVQLPQCCHVVMGTKYEQTRLKLCHVSEKALLHTDRSVVAARKSRHRTAYRVTGFSLT